MPASEYAKWIHPESVTGNVSIAVSAEKSALKGLSAIAFQLKIIFQIQKDLMCLRGSELRAIRDRTTLYPH